MKKVGAYFLLCLIVSVSLLSCNQQPATDKNNPFFAEYNTPFNVPPFEKIKAEHYVPAFERGMAEGREDLKKIIANTEKPDFKNTIDPLDRMGELLTKVSYVFFGITSANTNDSLQKIEVDISPKLSEYRDEMFLNAELFKKVKSIYDDQANLSLDDEQKFLLENLYKSFVRNGALLSPADQDTLKTLN